MTTASKSRERAHGRVEWAGATFPKALRVLSRRDFVDIQAGGAKIGTDCVVALVKRNGRATTRLGLTVSGKVGNAVVRNRIRRRLRELFRVRRQELPVGLDVVLIARTMAATAEWRSFVRSFDKVVTECARKYPL